MDFYFGTIFSMPWQARIVEVREEIDRVLSQTADSSHKADSILRLLQDKQLDKIGLFHVISCYGMRLCYALLSFSSFSHPSAILRILNTMIHSNYMHKK